MQKNVAGYRYWFHRQLDDRQFGEGVTLVEVPMSANHSTAIGMLGWTDAPPARVLPRHPFSRLLGFGFAATALFRIREFLAAFKDRRPKPPAGGGPDEPPEDPPRANLWDDPALWMLMLH